MSLCDKTADKRRRSSIGCCGSIRASETNDCFVTTARIPLCNSQSNVQCLDHNDCGGVRPTGTAATGACPGPCQCVEEEIWNSNTPPKPNCEWLNNFTELRRQWSDHGRQHLCKYCICRSCRTVTRCQSYFPPIPRCFGTTITLSDCQKCCGNRRLAGGASKSEMTPTDNSSSPERVVKREAGGGGCPQFNCGYQSTHCDPSNTDCSSTTSDNPQLSQCRYFQRSLQQTQCNCQSSILPLKPILKKRNCCRRTTNYCICQPMMRSCNCPAPVQIDARAHRECSCDCPSSPECACPPSERRFPRKTVDCSNARLCCPFPRLSPNVKCYCAQCQSRSLPSCNQCTSIKCQCSISSKDPGRFCSSYPPCLSCRPVSPASTKSSCRPPTPCRKLTFCTERSSQLSSPHTGTDQFCDTHEIIDNNVSEREQNDIETREKYDTKDSTSSCKDYYFTDYTITEDKPDNTANESSYSLSNEGSVKKMISKESVNLLEDIDPTKPVDSDPTDMLEKIDKINLTKATGSLERSATEISLKDSRHTSIFYAQSDNSEKSDHHIPCEDYFHIGGDTSENSAPAKLPNNLKSSSCINQKDLPLQHKSLLEKDIIFHEIPQSHVELLTNVSISTSTSSTHGIDGRYENNKSSLKDIVDPNKSSVTRIISWNTSKFPLSITHNSSVSVSSRQNRSIANLFRKLKSSASTSSPDDQKVKRI